MLGFLNYEPCKNTPLFMKSLITRSRLLAPRKKNLLISFSAYEPQRDFSKGNKESQEFLEELGIKKKCH